MLRVGANYQRLTRDASFCFKLLGNEVRFFPDVARSLQPVSLLPLRRLLFLNNPTDARTSVNPSKVRVAIGQRSRRCDRW